MRILIPVHLCWRAVAILLLLFGTGVHSQWFRLPTSNDTLFDSGQGQERFYVGTAGREWPSGSFGCVRSDGWRMHEGIDIRCLERDAANEPVDPVFAAAAGQVAYINKNPRLSNYGIYIVLEHSLDRLTICTLYAHLREIAEGMSVGQQVFKGQRIGTMGRTANTVEGISRDRAHLHFEVNFQLNHHFELWFAEVYRGGRNDHQNFNGLNLVSVNPSELLLLQHRSGEDFRLRKWIQRRSPLFRVEVRKTSFPWLAFNPGLVFPNPSADERGTAGYEIAFDYNGLPFQLIPRTEQELSGTTSLHLLSVNEEVYKLNPCRGLVQNRRGNWQLTERGKKWIDLLVFTPKS